MYSHSNSKSQRTNQKIKRRTIRKSPGCLGPVCVENVPFVNETDLRNINKGDTLRGLRKSDGQRKVYLLRKTQRGRPHPPAEVLLTEIHLRDPTMEGDTTRLLHSNQSYALANPTDRKYIREREEYINSDLNRKFDNIVIIPKVRAVSPEHTLRSNAAAAGGRSSRRVHNKTKTHKK